MARILTGEHARDVLGGSLDPLARAIAASLGPSGRAVVVAEGAGFSEARTGAAIARAAADDEGARSIAPRILRETLVEAERDLGDGTARLAVIAAAIVARGRRFIAAGHSPGALADAVLGMSARASAALDRERMPAPPLAWVASAAGLPGPVSEALVDAVERAGPDGVIEVVPAGRPGVEARFGEGYLFDGVLLSEAFAEGTDRTRLVLDPAHVLVADEIIDDFGPLVPILEAFAPRGKALVVVARDVVGPALATLVRNRREAGMRVAALKPADVAHHAGDVLEDLALATGATLIADRTGHSLARLRPGMLGRAGALRFARGRATFADPAGDGEAVAARARYLAAEAERQRYLALDRERLLRRAARLRGTWAELRVGASGERATDALVADVRAAAATLQSAARDGVVVGGGAALHRVAERLVEETSASPLSVDHAAAACVAAGLREVRRQILLNGGGGERQPALAPRPGPVSANQPEKATSVPDPLALTQALVGRALSVAATLLRVDAIICT